MRQWQVGDPVGDGNDIGVPDVEYMGYLKGKRRRSSPKRVVEFYSDMSYSKSFYESGSYDLAFLGLKMALDKYEAMSNYQKSEFPDDYFKRDWIVDLCCMAVNAHGEKCRTAIDMIVKLRLPVKLCYDCDLAYPSSYKRCTQCGRSLHDPCRKSPEQIVAEIPDIMAARVWNSEDIQRLVERSLRLMKSNDCRLVRIEPGIGSDTDFVFEKETKYLKTTYVCNYMPQYSWPRIFEDFYSFHNHDGLLADESFQKLIRDTEFKTGFRFKECCGGFGDQFDDDGYNFIFNDLLYLTVDFVMGDGRLAVYDIDLDRMKLSDEYRVY